jgi:hypothetical protein
MYQRYEKQRSISHETNRASVILPSKIKVGYIVICGMDFLKMLFYE